jgi:hypothetical protein
MLKWYVAHKIGDLVRVNNNCEFVPSCRGELGIVLEEPDTSQINLFIKVYILRLKQIIIFTPREIDIISNID